MLDYNRTLNIVLDGITGSGERLQDFVGTRMGK